MSGLKLADTLALPLDAVTETFGILAVRGAGKWNTAAVMAEEMFKAKLPLVVVDPVRAWGGCMSSLRKRLVDCLGNGSPHEAIARSLRSEKRTET